MVSVIIPNYNHERYLKQRIDSVLAQTFTDFELILLDDCSTDNSPQILLSYQDNSHVSRILINSANSGSPFAQWEEGIRQARGKYIWIAESDDSAEPEFLSLTVAQLEAHPEVRLCLTGSYIIDEDNQLLPTKGFDPWKKDGKPYYFSSDDYLSTHMLHTNSVYNASMVLFRRERCLSGIATSYRDMRYCGDWLFWIEQIRKGGVIEIHQRLNYFRKHRNNTTHKGTLEGNSLGEMAFIKNVLYTSTIQDWRDIARDKHQFYRTVKHFPYSSAQRRKEQLKIIARKGNITYKHYLLWKVYKLYRKYIRRAPYEGIMYKLIKQQEANCPEDI